MQEQGAFNANSGKLLTINGGYVLVDASGDGLDSNGSLSITGGTILVSGAENSGNGALDYNTSASISGGTLIALGSSGMSQSITGDGQCTIMTEITAQSSDTMFVLCDSNSNVIASFKPAKQFSNVVVSSPSLKTGESYKIICGNTGKKLSRLKPACQRLGKAAQNPVALGIAKVVVDIFEFINIQVQNGQGLACTRCM